METDNGSEKVFENMNDEERRLYEQKKTRENMVYSFIQSKQVEEQKKIRASVQKIEKPLKQVQKAIPVPNIKITPPKTPAKQYYSFSQLGKAAQVFEKHLDKIEARDKDANFFLMRKNLADVQQNAEELNKIERPLTDNERNRLRMQLRDLSQNCQKFADATPNGRQKSQGSKDAAKQIKNFAESEKQKICDAETKEIEDFNARMKVIADCCVKLNKIEMFLTQAGIRKGNSAGTPPTETLSAKQLGTQLNTLAQIAKIADNDKDDQTPLRNQTNESALAILNHLQHHPELVKDCGLSKERLKEIHRIFTPEKQLNPKSQS